MAPTQTVTVVTAVEDNGAIHTFVLPGKVDGYTGAHHNAVLAVYKRQLVTGVVDGTLRDDMFTWVTHHELPLPEVY